MRKFLYCLMAVALIAGLALQFTAVRAFAASATGTARGVVIAALSIANVSALDFGTAPAGDPAKIIPPGTAESATNGSFTVTGQPSTAYTITLPTTSINMITGAGGANGTIVVNAFLSFPATNGMLSTTGTQLLLVGATRAALLATQTPGTYTGTYTVTVVY